MNIISHILLHFLMTCICLGSASSSMSVATHHFENMKKKGWSTRRFIYFLAWIFQSTGLIGLGMSLLIMNKDLTRFCMYALAISTASLSITPCSISFFRTKIGKVIRALMLFAGAAMYIYVAQTIM